jgi:chromosome segregation ATPase
MLSAYLQFLNETHKGSSEENLRTLEKRLADIADKLDELTQERLELKASAPDLVDTGDKNSSNLSVVSESIRILTTDYSNARKATQETRNLLNAIERAIANNEDILPFAQKALDSTGTTGRQLIEQSLGLSTQNAYLDQRMTQELVDLQSELRTAQQKLGPNHPRALRHCRIRLRPSNSIWNRFPSFSDNAWRTCPARNLRRACCRS